MNKKQWIVVLIIFSLQVTLISCSRETTGPENGTDTRIYTLNQDSTVSVINGNTNSVITTIELEKDCWEINVNAETNLIYLTDYRNGNLYVVDGNTLTETSIEIKQYAQFSGIGINSSTNKIYLADKYSSEGAVIVVNGTNNSVIDSIEVGERPLGMAVNPTTNCIYVTNSYDNTVSVINGNTNAMITTIGVGIEPRDVAVNPNANRIYVLNDYGTASSVSVINGNNNLLAATININGAINGIGVNPNTNRIYVTHGDKNIIVINGDNNSIVDTIKLADIYRPGDVAVNPNTNRIYVTHGDMKDVIIIDGNTNSVIDTIIVGHTTTKVAIIIGD